MVRTRTAQPSLSAVYSANSDLASAIRHASD
jgi:hypothetical protein